MWPTIDAGVTLLVYDFLLGLYQICIIHAHIAVTAFFYLCFDFLVHVLYFDVCMSLDLHYSA